MKHYSKNKSKSPPTGNVAHFMFKMFHMAPNEFIFSKFCVEYGSNKFIILNSQFIMSLAFVQLYN
jgi:hypothetical protein